MNAPIGVFDSGVGGLTVAREIMRQLPEESMRRRIRISESLEQMQRSRVDSMDNI